MKVDALLVTMNDYFQTSQTSIPSQWVVIIKPKMVDSSSTLSISPFFALTRLPKEEVESLSESWLTKQRIAARMDWLSEVAEREGKSKRGRQTARLRGNLGGRGWPEVSNILYLHVIVIYHSICLI